MGELLEVVAYAEDCRVVGRIELNADRLTDMLARDGEFVLRDAAVEALADGRVLSPGDVPVSRDELLAIHMAPFASGPRGDPSRHVHTRRYPVVVRTGPYSIGGYVHVPAGVRPEDSTRRRGMMPLSDGWVQYACAGQVRHVSVDLVVVNREVADSIEFTADEDVAPPTV